MGGGDGSLVVRVRSPWRTGVVRTVSIPGGSAVPDAGEGCPPYKRLEFPDWELSVPEVIPLGWGWG